MPFFQAVLALAKRPAHEWTAFRHRSARLGIPQLLSLAVGARVATGVRPRVPLGLGIMARRQLSSVAVQFCQEAVESVQPQAPHKKAAPPEA